jgi:hypothetical protein
MRFVFFHFSSGSVSKKASESPVAEWLHLLTQKNPSVCLSRNKNQTSNKQQSNIIYSIIYKD